MSKQCCRLSSAPTDGVVSMAVALTDDRLHELRDCLRGRPKYLKIYNEVVTRLDGLIKGFDFFVDKWPYFKAVVAKPNPQTMEFEILSSVYNIGGDDATSVIQLLESPGVVDWTKKCVFACVDASLSSALSEAMSSHGGKSDPAEPCFIMSVTTNDLDLRPIPEGFKMFPLTPDHSDLVNDMWKFTIGDQSHSYIKTLISSLPSCCLYDKAGTVLGFAMSYHYGALGLLHVMEEHRGKGYGKMIMSHLANERLKLGRDAFVVIEESNEVSVKLHESLGFKKVPDVKVTWIRNTPKGCCAGPKTCCI